MSSNPSEPRYRCRIRVRADHDEAPLQNAREQTDEQQAENAEQQFGEHVALGARASGAGNTDEQASTIAPADPAAKATLLAGMQQQHGNRHVQRVVQRLRVQRDPNKNSDTKDDPGAKTDTPKLADAIAAKYPHLARVLTTEQMAQWQNMIDAYAPWKVTQKQISEVSANLYFQGEGVSGSGADVARYEALQRKADKQALAIRRNVYLDVPTEFLLAPDVLDPGLTGGKEEAQVIAFHTRLYDRLVSVPTRVWLGGEVQSVEDFQKSLWPVHFSNPVFEAELGSDGGQIHWQQLMKASQGLALDYQQVLLQAQAQVTGQMMDISSRTYADEATNKMREDIFKIRRILGYMHVSDSDEGDMLEIVRKWSEADAKADDATKHGMAVHYGRKSDTPLFDEFIGMTRTMTYGYSSIGTAWIDQTTTIYDGLWEEMEGSHYQQLAELINRSKLWGGRAGRMTPKMESVWSYVGKREALAGWGIVSALGQGLTGLFDLGMWVGYKAAGGEGDAPAITPWLSKRQDKVAEAMAGGMGIDLTQEKTAFGLDPFHFARVFGAIPAGLMTAGAMAPLGEAGALITGAQTLKQVDSLVDKVKKMRAAGKSWSDIMQDPSTWVEVVGVVAGAIGTAGSLQEAGSAARALLDQMGTAANIGKMELLAAAYYAVDDDPKMSAADKGQRKAELLADFLSTGATTIDMRYGQAFKEHWEARYAQGKGTVNPEEPASPGGKPEEGTTAKSGAAKDATVKEPGAENEPTGAQTKTGGQAYTGKRPPPVPLGGKGFNEPIGNPVHTVEQGRAILRRLADGDAGALSAIGVKVPDNYNPVGREWGLARTPDKKYVIVQGSTGGVEWEQLIARGLEPLSHSHPLFMGREMMQPGVTPKELIDGDNIFDKVHVLPSVEDIRVAAQQGWKWHEVQTPFVHQGDGKIGNFTGNEPGLSIVMHDAVKMGESPSYYYYKVRLEFISGGKTVWTGEVWAWSSFVRDGGFFSTTQPDHFKQATPTAVETAPPTTTTRAAVVPPGSAVVDWNKKLSASGNAGSLGARKGYGVFEGQIPGVPHPVAIKVYPANKHQKFTEDMQGAEAASRTGLAAKFYGQVDVGPGKLAFAMEKIEGGFPRNESTEPKGSPGYQQAQQEADFYASKITQQTIQDIKTYSARLIQQGYYYAGEVQGMIDAQGRWIAMDFQGIEPLPTDPAARKAAIDENDKNFKMEIDSVQSAAVNQPTP